MPNMILKNKLVLSVVEWSQTPAFGRKSEALSPKSSAGHLTAETRRIGAK